MRAFARLAAVAAAFPFAIACSEQGFVPDVERDGLGPEIQVDPLVLDFGVLSPGEQAVLPFTITNVGSSDLHVTGIPLEGASFTILDGTLDFVLPPGAFEEIEVAYSPVSADEQVGFADVLSNDADDPAVEVDLLGGAAAPHLVIEPDPHDFGQVFVGCDTSEDIALSNDGNADLVIDAISYESTDGQLVMTDTNALPLTLVPGTSATVRVDFAAEVEGDVDGALVVHSNDPRGEVRGRQLGEAIYAAYGEDTFTIPTDPPVDILFAVDQSCSMDAMAQHLADEFDGFIGAIGNVTSNWRIGVVTLDSGCFNQGILTAGTPDLMTKFRTAVRQDDVYGMYDTEALFRLTLTSLGKTGSGQCNANFLRPNAMLHVVFVTDEWEQSGMAPQTWVSQAGAFKSSPALLKASGFVCPGDYGDSCPTGYPDGYVGNYDDAISMTGGVRLDITAGNWAQHAEDLALASLEGLYDFELSDTADPDSVRVWVNGTEWTNGWHYDPVTNAVVLDGDVNGGHVTVTYGVMVDCN